jgi:hypothetical protein
MAKDQDAERLETPAFTIEAGKAARRAIARLTAGIPT